MLELFPIPDVFADLPAVELGHHHIEDHQIRLMDDDRLERLGPIGGFDEVAVHLVEMGAQEFAQLRVVVGHQDHRPIAFILRTEFRRRFIQTLDGVEFFECFF